MNAAFRKRSKLLRFFLLVFMLMLILRLTYIQVAQAGSLSKEANEYIQADKTIQGARGTIYDRNNEKLAFTGVAYDLNIDLDRFRAEDAKKNGDTPEEYARFLAPLLGETEQNLIQYMDYSNPKKKGAGLGPKGRKVDPSVNDKIQAMHKQKKFLGITTMRTDIRQYPNGQFASHILGYYGPNPDLKADSKDPDKQLELGLSGVESTYNDQLRGKPGQAIVYTDKEGNPLPMYPEDVKVPPVDGEDVVLTVDSVIQHYVDDELNKIVEKYAPKHAAIIVADPNNGEILAMGNRPSYDPNNYAKTDQPDSLWDDWALRSFEPGSTFKIFVLTGALNEHKLDLSETFQSGGIWVDGQYLKDWNEGEGFGTITYRQAVYHSSNVGFIKIGQKLGKDALYDYIYGFGFNKKTGIDLPGEGNSVLFNPAKMRNVDLATSSFGQGISVTPIQQVSAAMAVANGGKVYQPHVVKELRSAKTGETVKEIQPKVLYNVANDETMSTVRQVMEETMQQENPQVSAYIPGYHVAGKTGTAQVAGDDGTYEDDKYRLSFIGFAPAGKPRLLVYVTVDQPAPGTAPLQFGSYVAEPSAKVVLENSLRYLQVPIDAADVKANADKAGGQNGTQAAPAKQVTAAKAEEPKTFVNVPDFVGSTKQQADDLAKKGQLKLSSVGDGPKVTSQWPDPTYGQVPAGSEVKLYYGPEGSEQGKAKVPDLKGLSLREAMATLSLLQLDVDPSGTGFVSKQGTAPGTLVPYGTKIKLELAPQS